MLDFQQKRKIRGIMYNRVTLYILAIIVIFVIHSTWGVYQKKKESEKLRDISLGNVEELRLRDSELKSQIERLNTSTGVEEEIRSKFNVAKENENMVLVIAAEDSEIPTTTKKVGFWEKIVNFFEN